MYAAVRHHHFYTQFDDFAHIQLKLVLQFAEPPKPGFGPQRLVVQFLRFQCIVNNQHGRMGNLLWHLLGHAFLVDDHAEEYLIVGIFLRHNDIRQFVVRFQQLLLADQSSGLYHQIGDVGVFAPGYHRNARQFGVFDILERFGPLGHLGLGQRNPQPDSLDHPGHRHAA